MLLLIGIIVFLLISVAVWFGARHLGAVTMIAAFVAGLALSVPILLVFYYKSISGFLEGLVANITAAFGLSSELLVSFALFLVVPASIVVGFVLSLSRQHRMLGMSLVIVGITASWGMLWVGSQDHLLTADGEQLHCFTITQDGVRFFEREQVDPRTGERCQWVDQFNLSRDYPDDA